MGKTISKVCQIITPLACLADPITAVVLSGIGAVSNFIIAKQQQKLAQLDLHNCINHKFYHELQMQQQQLRDGLKEINTLYNKHFSELLQHQAMMNEYFATIRDKLAQEKICLERLSEVLMVLDLCAKGGDGLVEKIAEFKPQIEVLLHWGLLHISVLALNHDGYYKILELVQNMVDCYSLDYLGHSILEYAYLSGDLKLIAILKAAEPNFNNKQKLLEAGSSVVHKRLSYSKVIEDLELLEDCLGKQDYNTVGALLTINNFNINTTKLLELIVKLIELAQIELLKQLIKVKGHLIDERLIQQFVGLYQEPRSYLQELALFQLQATQWLVQNRFDNTIDLRNFNDRDPLEYAIMQNHFTDFINLLACKADPYIFNADNHNILMFAIKHEKTAFINYLLREYNMDPYIYNMNGDNAYQLLLENPKKFKSLINYIEQNSKEPLYAISEFRLSSLIKLELNQPNLFIQTQQYYNLWSNNNEEDFKFRAPIVLGLYVAGMRFFLRWTHLELFWLTEKLGLGVRLFRSGHEYKVGLEHATLINVYAAKNELTAIWDQGTISITEPDYQHLLLDNYDLALINNYSETAIKTYVESNYKMQEFFLSKFNIKTRNRLEYWLKLPHLSYRLDELPTGVIIQPKDLNRSGFTYYYEMPVLDLGYQILGISRITAIKLLLDYIHLPEIIHCIKVELIYWLINSFIIPKEFAYRTNIVLLLQEYWNNENILKQDATMMDLKFQQAVIKLYDLINLTDCILYLGKTVAVPGNYLNNLKYYDAIGEIQAGGILLALANIMNISLKIWKSQDDEFKCIWQYIVKTSKQELNIWDQSEIPNQLIKGAILVKEQPIQIKPIVTHLDLYARNSKNSDLSVILHGWLYVIGHNIGLIPQNDLLALLVKVKLVMNNQLLEPEVVFKEIIKYRCEFSEELSVLLGSQLNRHEKISPVWNQVANYRVTKTVRKILLQEHTNLIEFYSNNIRLMQQQARDLVDSKVRQLDQQIAVVINNFEVLFKELADRKNYQEQVLLEHYQQVRFVLETTIDQERAMLDRQINLNHKKLLKQLVISFCTYSIAPNLLDLINRANKIDQLQGKSPKVSVKLAANPKRVTANLTDQIANTQDRCANKLLSSMGRTFLTDLSANLLNLVIHNPNSKNIFKESIIMGVKSIYNFSVKHFVKFSNNYIRNIIDCSVDGIIEALKSDRFSMGQLLLNISNKFVARTENHILAKAGVNKQFKLSKEIHNFNLMVIDQSKNNRVDLAKLTRQSNVTKVNPIVPKSQQKIDDGSSKPEQVSMSMLATTELKINHGLKKFKKITQEYIKQQGTELERNLEGLDLSISQKMILHARKLGLKVGAAAIDCYVPEEVVDLREYLLGNALKAELCFVAKFKDFYTNKF